MTKQLVSPGVTGRAPLADVTNALGDDLAWGVTAIAEAINRTPRQTFHLIQTKQIPVGKIGGRHVASKSALHAFFAPIVRGEVA